MSIAHPIFSDFSAGEESPRFLGRSDMPAYQRGARVIENMVPHVQGGVERRPGTIYVADVDDVDKVSRLVPWQGNTRQYVLELCENKIKIYRADTEALVHTINVTPSAWTEAQIPNIDWDFDGANVMYFVHPDWKPKKLVHNTETGDTDWTLSEPTISVANYSITASLFKATNYYPSCVCFYAGRLVFACTNTNPNYIYFSNGWNTSNGTSQYENFDLSTASPKPDTAGFCVGLGFARGGKVTWIAGRNALIGGTNAGEFILGSGDNGLTPNWPGDIKCYTFYGGNNRKLRVGDGVLFVQKGGRKLREMLVTQANQYIANDLMVVSDHIGGPGITDIDFQLLPNPRIYACRSDGEVSVLTYEAQYDMKAWSRFITGDQNIDGGFESFAVVSNASGQDQIWCIARRHASVGDLRFIEKFAPWEMRDWPEFENAVYVDCATVLDLVAADIDSVDITTLVTIHATAHGLTDGMKIRFTGPTWEETTEWYWPSTQSLLVGPIYTVGYIDANTFILRNEEDTADIDATTGLILTWEGEDNPCPVSWEVGDTLTGDQTGNTATIVGFNADRTVVYFNNGSEWSPFWVSYDEYDESITAHGDTWYSMVGLSYLYEPLDGQVDTVEQVMKDFTGYQRYGGRELQVFADKIVQPPVEVDNYGAFSLAQYANYIVFGYEYDSVLKLMPIEAGVTEGSAQGRKKRIDRVTLRLINSVGCMVGPAEDQLVLAKFRQTMAEMGEVTEPQDGDIEVSFPGDYDSFGDLFVVQNEPLPLTVVAVMPRIETTE